MAGVARQLGGGITATHTYTRQMWYPPLFSPAPPPPRPNPGSHPHTHAPPTHRSPRHFAQDVISALTPPTPIFKKIIQGPDGELSQVGVLDLNSDEEKQRRTALMARPAHAPEPTYAHCH